MAKGDLLAVTLPDDVPILADLVAFAADFEGRGDTTRVIGGVAVTIWGLALGQPRGVATNDIDAVIPQPALTDATTIAAFATRLVAAATAAGYTPSPAHPRGFVRRAAPPLGERKIDLIAGASSLGRQAGRPPPARHLVEGPVRLTAGVNRWLDFVQDAWVAAQLTCAGKRARIEVPTCAGLAVLKVRAVLDKQSRVDAESIGSRRDHEVGRLARHLDDLILLREWIARLHAEPSLLAIANRHGDVVRAGARDAERWFLEADAALVTAVLGRAPRARRGLSDVRDALSL